MAIGIVGIKRGMTRIFTEEGTSVPVTVIEATPNRITQVKSVEIDGYSAIQVTMVVLSPPGSISPERVILPKRMSRLVVSSGNSALAMRKS